jgi:Uma2 family endonuclease
MDTALSTAPVADVPEDGVVFRQAMTFEEFLRWTPEGGLTEWVNGEGVQYMSATKYHQRVIVFLIQLLGLFVSLRKLGTVCAAPYAMRGLPGGSVREPDVFFVGSDRLYLMRDTCFDGAADLVIEVVSDDSVARDRVEKFDEYQECGVREYWVIDPRPGRNRALFFMLNDGQFIPIKPDAQDVYRSTVLAGLELKVTWLWEESPDIPTILSGVR